MRTSASNHPAILVLKHDSRDDDLALRLLEQLWQRPCPVEPFVQDLDLFAVIGRDDVVHGLDVAAWIDPDRLS